MDVVLLRWPVERDRREELRRQGAMRLLLIEDDAPPPDDCDPLEDWVRLPAPDADVRTRVRALQARAHDAAPTLDEQGVLRHGGRWVALPPVEARLARVLLDRMDLVVGRDALARAGWPRGLTGRNALDVHMVRLRRRLAGVGLVIRTLRSRGYLLEAAPGSGSGHEPVRHA